MSRLAALPMTPKGKKTAFLTTLSSVPQLTMAQFTAEYPQATLQEGGAEEFATAVLIGKTFWSVWQLRYDQSRGFALAGEGSN